MLDHFLMKLKTINTYNNSIEAHLAKAVLDGIGIFAVVVGDNLENTGGPYFGAGLVELKVNEVDEEPSLVALKDNGLL